MTCPEIQSKIDALAAQLGEHCDSAFIMVTVQEQGETYYLSGKNGNGYATNGALTHYMANTDEFLRENIRKQLDE